MSEPSPVSSPLTPTPVHSSVPPGAVVGARGGGGSTVATGGGKPVASRVAANLLILRQRAGLTQQQLASAARVSRATINLLESGNADPRVSTLELIAAALGVDPADLTEDGRVADARNDGATAVANAAARAGLRSDGRLA